MKVLITGGHMGPALAVIEKLPKDTEIVYVGRMYPFEGDKGVSLEYQTITKRGITFLPLATGRIQRHISLRMLLSLVKLPRGFYEAYKILRREKPDVVVGFGGYLSVPVGLMASFLHVPVVIHEQTLGAGLANKVLGKVAMKVCLSWQSSQKYFPKEKTILTGNPLMKDESSKESSYMPESKEKLPLLLIVGGSAGSHAINQLVEGALEKLLEKYLVIHQTGDAKEFNDFERLTQKSSSLENKHCKRYRVVKFIDPGSISSLFKKADLIASRAGINTVTTLVYLQKPALLIPLPYGQHNEQLANAQMFADTGLGEIFEERHATSARLLEKVTAMMDMRASYRMKKEIPFPRNAAERIIEVILLCCHEEFKKEKPATLFID